MTMKDENMGGDGDEGFEEIKGIIVEDHCRITVRLLFKSLSNHGRKSLALIRVRGITTN